MLLEILPKSSPGHPQMHPKSTLGPSLEPDLKKALSLRSKACPKGAQNAPQKHPRGLLGTQLAHFCGQNAAIESITVFKHIFERFLVLF